MLKHENDGAGDAGTGPGTRLGHGLAYNAANGFLLLFGGFRASGVPLDDTWGWDGERWALLADDGPAPRAFPGMTYESKGGRPILFGG